MKKLFGMFAFVALTGFGCATAPQSPQQTIFTAKADYAIALAVAVAYKNLPICMVVESKFPCSKVEIVAILQKVDTASSALLNAAETTVRVEGAGVNVTTALTAATQAVAAFVTITNGLTVK